MKSKVIGQTHVDSMNDAKIKYRNLIIILIILLELEVAAYVILDNHRKKILAANLSVSAIAGSSVTFLNDSGLKHFYEPKGDRDVNNSEPAWLKFKPVYHINHDTLRDRYDYTPEKPAGTFRIMTMGDSFTYGLFVGDDQTYSRILENKLNELGCTSPKKFEVINLGVQGYDVKYAVERFKLRGQKYDPDLVIWYLKYDDIEYINELLLPKVDEYMKKLGGGRIEPQAYNVWGKAFEDILKQTSIKEIIEYDNFAFKEFNDLFQNKLLLYAPKYTFASTDTDIDLVLKNYSKSREGISLYESDLNLTKDGKVFPDYHPNQAGHKAIAEDLLNYLQANKLITCK